MEIKFECRRDLATILSMLELVLRSGWRLVKQEVWTCETFGVVNLFGKPEYREKYSQGTDLGILNQNHLSVNGINVNQLNLGDKSYSL